jgi:hypothetical protein
MYFTDMSVCVWGEGENSCKLYEGWLALILRLGANQHLQAAVDVALVNLPAIACFPSKGI